MTQQDAPSSHRVAANGLNMFYLEAGQGPALVLLHGGTGTSSFWSEQLPVLAHRFHVFALDSRGHGQTDNPHGSLSYPAMADDVAGFTAALQLEQPLVAGYSDGGQIALELGLRHPTLPRALVVGGASHTFRPGYFEELRSWGFDGPHRVDVARMQLPGLPDFDWGEWVRHQHVRDDDPTYWRTLLDQVSELWYSVRDYSADELGAISAPTLVFIGDRDATIPLEQNVEMYRLLPHAELFVVPNATHFSTASEIVNPAVLSFLERHAPDPSEDR
jgi:pimeloyl-ACP methyl ester carboxylesterase